jgi:hypothetical protein
MACGTPVVASRTTSIPEVVGDAGVLVDPTDIADLANGMRQVLQNRSLHHDLCEKGLRRARTFSWKSTAQLTLAAYAEAYDRWRREGARNKRPPARTKYQARLHEWVLEQTREHMYRCDFNQRSGVWP